MHSTHALIMRKRDTLDPFRYLCPDGKLTTNVDMAAHLSETSAKRAKAMLIRDANRRGYPIEVQVVAVAEMGL